MFFYRASFLGVSLFLGLLSSAVWADGATSRPASGVVLKGLGGGKAAKATSQPISSPVAIPSKQQKTSSSSAPHSDELLAPDTEKVDGKLDPVVQKMLSSLPSDVAILGSIRLNSVLSLRSFVKSSWSRWFRRQPPTGLEALFQRKSTKDFFSNALKHLLGIEGKLLEDLKKMIYLSDLQHPILVAPAWFPTKAGRDLNLLGAVDPFPYFRGDSNIVAPLFGFITIPTQDSRGWLKLLEQAVLDSGLLLKTNDPKKYGLKEGVVLHVKKRLFIFQPKEGFVRVVIFPLLGSMPYLPKQQKQWERILRETLAEGSWLRRVTPSLLHMLQSSSFVGAYLHPHSLRKLGTLMGMREADKALDAATWSQKKKLFSLYALIASETWSFFSSPKTEFEDLALVVSLKTKSLEMVSSFTRAGLAAYKAGLSNAAPSTTSLVYEFLSKGAIDINLLSAMESLKDAFPWSRRVASQKDPLSRDLWRSNKILSRYRDGGLFMHSILLSSGSLRFFRALHEAGNELAFFVPLLPHRFRWAVLPLGSKNTYHRGPSFALSMVFAPGQKKKVAAWYRSTFPPSVAKHIQQFWEKTPSGDCWFVGYETNPRPLFSSCLQAKKKIAGGRVMGATVDVAAVLDSVKRYLQWQLRSYRRNPYYVPPMYRAIPWLDSERLFGSSMSLHARAVATTQARWMQMTFLPTSMGKLFPKIPLYADVASPRSVPAAWSDPKSPLRCLAQLHVTNHARLKWFDRASPQDFMELLQARPIDDALLSCIEKEPLYRAHVARIRAYLASLKKEVELDAAQRRRRRQLQKEAKKKRARQKAAKALERKRNAPLLTPTKKTRPIFVNMSKRMISRTIRRYMRRFRYCYERELRKNPQLGGKITIYFQIEKDGSVSKERIKSTTMLNERVESCLLARARRMRFLPPPNGLVQVVYPFVFRSK